MDEKHIIRIADETGIKVKSVEATARLLEEGGTIPFIARYRKEATGSLDEVQVQDIRDMLDKLAELDKRREAILESISSQGKLTDELKEKIEAAKVMSVLEDLYLPYKPKRRTRATIAKEKGLEPLAKLIFEQVDINLAEEVAKYIDEEKEVPDAETALAGARDIIAEWISEDQNARELLRKLYSDKGEFVCKVASGKAEEPEAAKYRDYFDWTEPAMASPSHRVLAMRRGANEKMLSMRICVPDEYALNLLEQLFVKASNNCAEQVRIAAGDSFKRLLSLSMETEMRLETKKKADEVAIKVFSDNLRQLLMAAPLGQMPVMALDPGFRTGCKLVCLDAQGKLLHNEAIYPHNGQAQAVAAGDTVIALCQKFGIKAIAIGNGTAGRETEEFVRNLKLNDVTIVMVNESGASVYSASEAAREEFADYDLTVRGAVSIGRRLMDPLAELVKIDPKSIGVGQYQHDVDQNMLKRSLDDTVESCVNSVGVEVNTASKQLLTYVAGLSSRLAGAIVTYREDKGPFPSRNAILEVSGMGAKTYEQAAGFLRIRGAENPLDSSAVHPESYSIVTEMANDLNCSVKDLVANQALRDKVDLSKYVTQSVGMPTLTDIMGELSKPGRDPREKFEVFNFADGINDIKDLSEGMELPGIVTNVTAFGCFVDIGVHQDGLVHISEMADRYISDPNEVVKVQQQVKVRVTAIDVDRKRIALSMKPEKKNQQGGAKEKKKYDKRPGNTPDKTGKGNKGQNRGNRNETFGSSLNIQL